MDRLQQLLEEGIIDEVFSQLKTGKEAEVWLVSHNGEPVAAKLYKEREFRNFKNDAAYKEGRTVRNSRTQRAMDKGSKFGRQASEEAWKSAEHDAMTSLFKAGVRVPKPVLFYDGVLLMEVIGDAEGRVAPRLVDAGIAREQAAGLYEIMRGEIVKMLHADLIHGDLSEFNVLLGVNGPIIIDFPQVVTAAKNSLSEQFFRRDLGNMLRFFGSIDPSISTKYAHEPDEIWRAYVRRYLSPHFVPRAPGQGKPQGPRFEPRGNRPQGPRTEQRPGQPPSGPRTDQRRGPPSGPRGEQPPGARNEQRPRQGFSQRTEQRQGAAGPRDDRRPAQPFETRAPKRPEAVPRDRETRQRSGPQVSYKGPPRK